MPPRRDSVIAHHLVWTVYGTWLPNDPRGSGSLAVATPALDALGKRYYGRRRVQPPRRIVREFYHAAQGKLRFCILRFDSRQIPEVAASLADAIHLHGYTCYGCTIMPDHVHVVIRKHRDRAEAMLVNLQDASRDRLIRKRIASREHPVWTTGGWKSFLDSPNAVRSAIRYVKNNPPRAGLPPQSWSFIKPYDNWPFHKRQPNPDP